MIIEKKYKLTPGVQNECLTQLYLKRKLRKVNDRFNVSLTIYSIQDQIIVDQDRTLLDPKKIRKLQ